MKLVEMFEHYNILIKTVPVVNSNIVVKDCSESMVFLLGRDKSYPLLER